MQSRGTSGPARSPLMKKAKKLPPAQLEAAIKRLEEKGRKETNVEKRARIAIDVRNLKVLARIKHLKKVETLGTKENPVGGKAR